MKVTSEIEGVRLHNLAARQHGCRIGCVPTMGALHEGHLSLIEECRKHVDEVVVTIFVNPSQFAAGEDLDKYPRPLDQDLEKCEQAGASLVYTPEIPSLYPEGYATWVNVEGMSSILEGEFRPTHFRGVTTIVLKLLNIIQPDVACFGAKDYQQQTIIRQMVRDLNLPTEIVICPTVREPDGLAMSSRNMYLSETERAPALSLSQALNLAEELYKNGVTTIAEIEQAMTEHLGSFESVVPDYAVLRDPDTLAELTGHPERVIALVAAKVGQTRLIDNRMIE